MFLLVHFTFSMMLHLHEVTEGFNVIHNGANKMKKKKLKERKFVEAATDVANGAIIYPMPSVYRCLIQIQVYVVYRMQPPAYCQGRLNWTDR